MSDYFINAEIFFVIVSFGDIKLKGNHITLWKDKLVFEFIKKSENVYSGIL